MEDRRRRQHYHQAAFAPPQLSKGKREWDRAGRRINHSSWLQMASTAYTWQRVPKSPVGDSRHSPRATRHTPLSFAQNTAFPGLWFFLTGTVGKKKTQKCLPSKQFKPQTECISHPQYRKNTISNTAI